MCNRDAKILTILRIGHETSMRGAGLPLRQALQQSRYTELRPSFDADDLVPLIRANRELVDQWMSYSEDKQTSGGWYLLRDGSLGRLSDPQSGVRFGRIEQAVAEYVVKELDFWAGLDEAG